MVIFNELFQTVRLSKWYLHFDTPSLIHSQHAIGSCSDAMIACQLPAALSCHDIPAGVEVVLTPAAVAGGNSVTAYLQFAGT